MFLKELTTVSSANMEGMPKPLRINLADSTSNSRGPPANIERRNLALGGGGHLAED